MTDKDPQKRLKTSEAIKNLFDLLKNFKGENWANENLISAYMDEIMKKSEMDVEVVC